jgi:glycosyltransferase involved in cell wall biosynthesis
LLILGTSATFALPLFRFLFPKVTYIVNMAGLEWSRSKWGPFARWYLKLNEKIAAKFSHFLVTDNMGLKDYVESEYKEDSFLIPYGGDQFLYASNKPEVFDEFSLPSVFDFAMARSQIDNNMEVILDAYAKSGLELVFVSNWNSTKYGQVIFQKYNKFSNLNLIGPIYDIGKIKALYSRTRLYVHGHSAGGTNPVLVESMWARLPILAFDVSFNRHTTQNKAFYFSDADELHELSASITNHALSDCAKSLFEIANNLYKWENVISLYESLIFDQPSE